MSWNGLNSDIAVGETLIGVNSGATFTITKKNSSSSATASYFAIRDIDKKTVFLKHYKSSDIDKSFFLQQKELYKRLYVINKSQAITEKNYEFFEVTHGKFTHHIQIKEVIENGNDLSNYLYADSKYGNKIKKPQNKVELIKKLLIKLSQIHANKIIHTDLKPEQIMIIQNGDQLDPLFIDFDHALYEKDGKLIGKSAGTDCWKSPEHIKNKQVSYESDTFTMACIIFTIFSGGHFPYSVDNYDEDVISYNARRLSNFLPEKLKKPLKPIDDLLYKAMNPDKDKRISLNKILKEFKG